MTIESLDNLINLLFETESWHDFAAFLQKYPELMDKEVERLLNCRASDAEIRGDREAARVISKHARLLGQCREQGIVVTINQVMQAEDEQDIRHAIELFEAESTPCAQKGELALNLASLYREMNGEGHSGDLFNARKWVDLALNLLQPGSVTWAEAKYLSGTLWYLADPFTGQYAEQAFADFGQALSVRTRRKMPLQWAHTRGNMALIWMSIAHHDPNAWAHAIRASCDSLKVISENEDRDSWIVGMIHLALAYAQCPTGKPVANLGKAIQLLKKTLHYLDPVADSDTWSSVINNLGTFYLQRGLYCVSDYEKAIALFKEALPARPKESRPSEWAQLQLNLGGACALYRGPHQEDYQGRARQAFEEVSRFLSPQTDPVRWTRASLGMAKLLIHSHRDDRLKSLNQALETLHQLEVQRDVTLAGLDKIELFRSLGQAYHLRRTEPGDAEKAVHFMGLAVRDLSWKSHRALLAQLLPDFAFATARQEKGSAEENLEEALAILGTVLKQANAEDFPVEWAYAAQISADLLISRRRGNRSQNLEKAIQLAESSKALLHPKRHSDRWFNTVAILASAYVMRIKGSPKENEAYAVKLIRRASKCLPKYPTAMFINFMLGASFVYLSQFQGNLRNHSEAGLKWGLKCLDLLDSGSLRNIRGQVFVNLGIAYNKRVKGLREENLKMARHYLHEASKYLSLQRDSDSWGICIHDLAFSYAESQIGDLVENQETALTLYHDALQIRTRMERPLDYALTMFNLGNLYRDRINGSRLDNQEQAKKAYKEALTVYTRKKMPWNWSLVRANLAYSLLESVTSADAENLDQAIAGFQSALLVQTRQVMPLDWAQTSLNLSLAWIRTGKIQWIKKALELLKELLAKVSRRENPFISGLIRNFLGAGYFHLYFSRRLARDAEIAQDYFRRAAAVFQPNAFPERALAIQQNLTLLLYLQGKWQAAYRSGLRAIRLGRNWESSSFARGMRMKISEDLYVAHRLCADALLRLKTPRFQAALSMIENGRTRLLRQAIWSAARAESTSQPLATQVSRLQSEINRLEAVLLTLSHRSSRTLIAQLKAKHRELETHLSNQPETNTLYDCKDESLNVELGSMESGALVVFLTAPMGTTLFVLPAGTTRINRQHILSLPFKLELSVPSSDKKASEYPWLNNYLHIEMNLRENPKDSFSLEAWEQAVKQVTSHLWETLMGPLAERLKRLGVLPDQEVILLPPTSLMWFPLHAAWRETPAGPRYFADEFAVSYAPSLTVLRACRGRVARFDGTSSLLSISDPDQLSIATRPEERSILARFPAQRKQRLSGKRATVTVLKKQAEAFSYLHISCHGIRDLTDPLKSGLILADRTLTVAEVSGHLTLRGTRLITLFACDGATIHGHFAPDEYVGLPSAFLQAGACAVISALWMVEEQATALLLDRFFYNHLLEKNSPSTALHQAQKWLRQMSRDAAIQHLEELRDAPHSTFEDRQIINQRILQLALLPKIANPYSAPIYWAGLTLVGA